MQSLQKQLGAIQIEGLDPELQRKAEELGLAKPNSNAILDAASTLQVARVASATRKFRLVSITFGALIGFFLAAWVAFWVRYEVIPVPTTDAGYIRYIVKDRWSGDIEVVWHTANGTVRRNSRSAFSE